MKSWYVYIAECGDGSLYTGITTNPSIRLKRHTRGRGSKYVRGRGVPKLVYLECHPSRSAATRRELEVKAWRREKKQALIAGGRHV